MIWILGLLLALGVCLRVPLRPVAKASARDLSLHGVSPAQLPPVEKIGTVISAEQLPAPVLAAVPAACDEFQNLLASSDITALLRQWREGFAEIPRSCEGFARVDFAELQQACAAGPDEFGNSPDDCMSLARVARAYAIQASTVARMDFEHLPAKVLLAKFVGREFPLNDQEKREYRRLAEELLRAAPAEPSSYIVMSILSLSGDGDLREGRAWIDEGLLRTGGGDPRLQDLYYYFRFRDGDFDYQDLAQRSTHPSAQFYLAGRALAGGRRDQAEALLKDLVRRNPGQSRYEQALARLRSGEEEPVLPRFYFPELDSL